MKKRIGFVSNSSSSSFIITTETDVNRCKELNIKLYKVSYLKEKFKGIKDAFDSMQNICAKYDWNNPEHPYFLTEDMHYMSFSDYNLSELWELNDDDYITDSVDRDWAYDKYLNFELFQGDL